MMYALQLLAEQKDNDETLTTFLIVWIILMPILFSSGRR